MVKSRSRYPFTKERKGNIFKIIPGVKYTVKQPGRRF